MPLSQKLLPRDINQLIDVEAQANLMVYIYHHSLFAFADKVYTMLNTQCTIVRKGLSHKQLLTNCINAPLPNHSTIGKVVDDETLLRIY